METSIRIGDIVKVIKSVSNTDGAVRKRNIINANKDVLGLFKVLTYSLGMIKPGYRLSDIDRPIFYIAPPKIYDKWDDLMCYYLRHPDGGDDNILVTYFFLRQQPKQEREMWHDVLSKRYEMGSETYIKHQFYEEEEFDESSYIRFRDKIELRNADETLGS